MYKVVRRRGRDLVSAYMSTIELEGLTLVFEPHVATHAVVGGITTFCDLQHAQRFARRITSPEIWRVRCRIRVALPACRFDGLGILLEDAIYLWRTGEAPAKHSCAITTWPDGTRAFKHVTLIGKVAWKS